MSSILGGSSVLGARPPPTNNGGPPPGAASNGNQRSGQANGQGNPASAQQGGAPQQSASKPFTPPPPPAAPPKDASAATVSTSQEPVYVEPQRDTERATAPLVDPRLAELRSALNTTSAVAASWLDDQTSGLLGTAQAVSAEDTAESGEADGERAVAASASVSGEDAPSSSADDSGQRAATEAAKGGYGVTQALLEQDISDEMAKGQAPTLLTADRGNDLRFAA